MDWGNRIVMNEKERVETLGTYKSVKSDLLRGHFRLEFERNKPISRHLIKLISVFIHINRMIERVKTCSPTEAFSCGTDTKSALLGHFDCHSFSHRFKFLSNPVNKARWWECSDDLRRRCYRWLQLAEGPRSNFLLWGRKFVAILECSESEAPAACQAAERSSVASAELPGCKSRDPSAKRLSSFGAAPLFEALAIRISLLDHRHFITLC